MFFCILSALFFLFSSTVFCQELKDTIESNFAATSQKAGYIETAEIQKTDLLQTVGNIINVALGIVGLLLLILIVYAGFQWMIARGDSKAVESAKNTIINAVIGLAIILASYAITYFVVNALLSTQTTATEAPVESTK